MILKSGVLTKHTAFLQIKGFPPAEKLSSGCETDEGMPSQEGMIVQTHSNGTVMNHFLWFIHIFCF